MVGGLENLFEHISWISLVSFKPNVVFSQNLHDFDLFTEENLLKVAALINLFAVLFDVFKADVVLNLPVFILSIANFLD